MLFNPGDSYVCVQSDGGTFDYQGVNISKEIMLDVSYPELGQPFESCIPECRQEIQRACEYMGEHFKERIYLDQIYRHAGLFLSEYSGKESRKK